MAESSKIIKKGNTNWSKFLFYRALMIKGYIRDKQSPEDIAKMLSIDIEQIQLINISEIENPRAPKS